MVLDSHAARVASYLLQRKIVSPRARNAVARMVAATRPKLPAANSPLATQGFLPLGPVLDARQIADVKAALGTGPLHDPYKHGVPQFHLHDVPANVHLGQYERSRVIRAPHLLELANRPTILACAAEVLGAKPTLTDMLAWWSFPGPAAPVDSQLWHRDCADWKMVKLFVYLTDVDGGSGPHVYARGTVHNPALTHVARFTDEQVAALSADVVTVTGPAGAATMTDPRGLHRATLPTERRRLIFEASYGLVGMPDKVFAPWGVEKVTRAGLDPWVNRFFVSLPE